MKKLLSKILPILCFVSTAIFYFGCQKDEMYNELTQAYLDENKILKSLSDGENNGNDNFFFLPPLVEMPDVNGVFDSLLSPEVRIYELIDSECSTLPIAIYTMSSGIGSEVIRVEPSSSWYIVNWHTDEFDLDTAITYRINVLVDEMLLGYADVNVVSKGYELKNVDTEEFVPLKDGRTLPIKFRIEKGALIPQEGLVAWYPFDGNVLDKSGNNLHATNNNTAFSADRFDNENSAALFNGSTSQVIMPENFHLGQVFTVCGWSYSRTAQHNQGCIFQSDWYRYVYYYEPFPFSVSIKHHNNNELILNTWGGNNYVTGIDSLKWYFWTLKSDGNNFQCYINNELKSSYSVTPNYGSGVYFPARFGRLTRNTNAAAGDLQNYWYNGLIDDVRIYNRELSEAEINILYSN